MKRFLMITLTAITAVALVAAPGWAAGGRKLSDRQLANVHAGASADADADAKAKAKARSSASTNIDAASSAETSATYASTSKLAVKVDNWCGTESQCKLKVETEAEGQDSSVQTNAQSILNTLASVNAVQVNVSNGAASSQSNMAYSAEGAISEVDSDQFAIGGVVGSSHADGTASGSSNSGTATAGGSGNSSVALTGTTTHTDGNSNQNTSTNATANSDADAASASSASSAVSSASTSASSGGAFTSASAASALAFATPKVKIINRCGSPSCKLKVETEAENGGSVITNAQSILNTVASVNAVQINVAGSSSTSQSNIAFSTVKGP